MQKRSDILISKRRSIEYSYMGLQMLYRRLPSEHEMKQVIYSKMLSAKAGIIGEKKVEEVFERYPFPFDYRVLHDVSLSSNGNFQMDTVFISPYSVVILECKNIVGELHFETEPLCLTRNSESGRKDTFESPEVQVDRNTFLMKEWLQTRGIDVPVKGVIVFSSTKSRVVKSPDHTDVIYATSIPVYLRTLEREKAYLSLSQMDDLAQRIASEHKPYFPYPMCKRWGINPTDLTTGVQCGKCELFGMVKIKRTWQCPTCSHRDSEAHLAAVKEWFVLIGVQMSNSDCRKFLQVSQHQTVTRILQGMDLIISGKGKATQYKMDKKTLSGQKNFYMDRKNFIRS